MVYTWECAYLLMVGSVTFLPSPQLMIRPSSQKAVCKYGIFKYSSLSDLWNYWSCVLYFLAGADEQNILPVSGRMCHCICHHCGDQLYFGKGI